MNILCSLLTLYDQLRYIFQKNFNFFKNLRKISIPMPDEKSFDSKTAIKTEFGTVSEIFGISQSCWDESWELLGFKWESSRFGSSHTDLPLESLYSRIEARRISLTSFLWRTPTDVALFQFFETLSSLFTQDT